MVTILKYVLLGIIFYIVVIPILEQLAALVCQGLEVIKGWLVYKQSLLQVKIDNIGEDNNKINNNSIQAIGFTIPTNECYEEDYEENE